MNQMCKVCGEPAAGFHFGAFTCEGCKSFFGRTYNNLSSISECKNNGECVINKKNRTACKACRLRKCLLVGMSKSGSRYGRRSNWFKIHCLLQEQQQQKNGHSAMTGSGGGGGGNSDSGSAAGGGGGGVGGGFSEGRNGGLFIDSAGMEKNMAKYLEHFGTNAMNAFRIRNNNNNNCESKYNFYEDKRLDYTKRSSCSKSDEASEDSNHSSSIVVDEDSQPNREESPSLDSPQTQHSLSNTTNGLHNNLNHHHHQHNLHHNHGPLFRPGIEPISPFSQKYRDFFISPFLQSVTTSLKRPSSDVNFETDDHHLVDQDTPIDLSIKSKISRISTGGGGGGGVNSNGGNCGGISIDAEPDRPKSACEMEKKNPLDLSLLPPRCNPILG